MSIDSNKETEGHVVVNDILVVDDDMESVDFVKKHLQAAGYNVSVARDGGQAHATFSMRRPDFVVTSIILPGESGFEICERMKHIDHAIPIMMLSIINTDRARDLAARVGADGYLTKPFDAETLVDMVREISEVVWDRQHGTAKKDERRIEFSCRCGQKFRVSFSNKGKAMTCSNCQARVQVPKLVENDRSDERAFRAGADQMIPTRNVQTLKFVTVKCQHCSTNYHLFPDKLEKARICPKCGQEQSGTLTISGIPLTRAALESSRRVFVIRSGKMTGKKMLLPEGKVLVGSSPKCLIRIPSDSVEPEHCALFPDKSGIYVKDLGSKSGTYVNNERIREKTLIQPGDLLQVGGLKLQLAGNRPHATGDERNRTEKSDDGVEKRYVKFKTTAAEAADVIQEFWEIAKSRQSDRDIDTVPENAGGTS